MTSYYSQEKYEAWIQARLGKVTASRLHDALAATRNGWSTSRRKYMVEIIAERLTGMSAERYWSESMQWGLETEHTARKAYENQLELEISGVGLFIEHQTIPGAGCSPDGLVSYDGLVEFKCPNSSTHISTMLDGKVDEKYLYQMMWQLACHPERKWCDYASFDPRLPPKMALHVQRFYRDEALIGKLEKQTVEFIQELERNIAILTAGHVASEDVSVGPVVEPQRHGGHVTSEDIAAGL